MVRPRLTIATGWVVVLVVCAGCRPPEEVTPTPTYDAMIGRLEAVMAALDGPSPDRRAVHAELDRLHAQLVRAAERDARMARELVELRKRLSNVEQATTVTDLELLFFSRLEDTDADAVADHLLLALAPKAGKDTVKAPGSMTVELCRRTLFPGGAGKVLQTWTFGENDLAAYWQGEDVFNRYEFRLELNREVLDNLRQKPFVVRVSFRPISGKPIVKELVVDEKMLK